MKVHDGFAASAPVFLKIVVVAPANSERGGSMMRLVAVDRSRCLLHRVRLAAAVIDLMCPRRHLWCCVFSAPPLAKYRSQHLPQQWSVQLARLQVKSRQHDAKLPKTRLHSALCHHGPASGSVRKDVPRLIRVRQCGERLGCSCPASPGIRILRRLFPASWS